MAKSNVKKTENIQKIGKFNLSAIEKRVVDNIPEIVEQERQGIDFIAFGKDNRLPLYLTDLYKNCTTLASIINTTTDMIIGESAKVEGKNIDDTVNAKGETIEEVMRPAILDYLINGCCAFEINVDGSIYHCPIKNLRSNKDNTVFYYSENYSKSYGRVKTIILPKYHKGVGKKSILFIKNGFSSTYGYPVYGQSLTACEMEREIAKYHLNALDNGFAPSVVMNLCNGTPEDSVKAEIERSITEKFTGSENAGRFLLNFCDDPDHKIAIDKIETENYGDKYKSLVDYYRDAIITSFRIPKVLTGLPNEGTVFNSENFGAAFETYKKLSVLPIQKVFKRALSKWNPIEIEPLQWQNPNLQSEDETEVK